MKITVRQLRRVIAEEVQRVLESSEYQQGLVYNDPNLDKQEINSINLNKYRWQLENDERGGTFDLTENNYNIIMQLMARDPNSKVNVFLGDKKIEFSHINDGGKNYFVGDTDGLARYFTMKMPYGRRPFLLFGLCTPNGGGVP